MIHVKPLWLTVCYTLHIYLPVLTGNSNGAIIGWNHYTTFMFHNNNKNNTTTTTNNNNIIIISVLIIILIIIIIIMKSDTARYPQLQLGHNALTKTYDQNNKAPKIKRRTHTHNPP